MAGTMAVPATPAAIDEASLGADSTLFVAVPEDVVMMYWFRAKRTAALVPTTHRLSWLQARDQEERAEWVARFRDSQKTPGAGHQGGLRCPWPALGSLVFEHLGGQSQSAACSDAPSEG